MGDFLIDLRPAPARTSLEGAAAFLKFHSDVRVNTTSCPEFSIVQSSIDDPVLWDSFDSGGLFVAIAGRVALEASEWDAAAHEPIAGGFAARWIAREYKARGEAALKRLNGNFVVALVDRGAGRLFIITDPGGAFPLFHSVRPGASVLGTHPDALAIAAGEDRNWDETSLAEFAYASLVTPPYTFYRNIRSIPGGMLISASLDQPSNLRQDSYFDLTCKIEPAASEADLADEFAAAFRRAITRRTLPLLGPAAVALSGGLDSRAIVAAAPERGHLFAFCCFDEENFEFSIAREIARSAGIKLVPIPRGFDYYAENAELGIRVSGGMGTFANNHFLGVAPDLRELGAENLLTGCYCDYLFKGLALNRRHRGVLGREELGPYSDQYYFTHNRLLPEPLEAVRERWRERFPQAIRASRDAAAVFELEKLRTFPLWHEGDNAQRLVPQRLMHGCLPFADRELLEFYCKLPYKFKLNRSFFKKAASRICGPALTAIPDANTGAPLDASLPREAVSAAILRAKRKLRKLRSTIATDASWPDWEYYAPRSNQLREFWSRPNPAADELFPRFLLPSDIRRNPADYTGQDMFFFVSLLNLKLWLSQRC